MSGHLTIEEKNDWRDSVTKSRMEDSEILVKWMEGNKIPFKKDYTGIKIGNGNIFVYWDLKVKFGGTQKHYQYNLEKIKERLTKDFL